MKSKITSLSSRRIWEAKPLLKLEDVSVKFGQYRAVEQISFEVEEGGIVVLLGANGAGKSSVFRAISGLEKLDGGSITFMGREIGGLSADRIVAEGIVQCAEGRKLFPKMSVQENLLLGAYVQRRKKPLIKETLQHVFELFPILMEKKNDSAGSLSGGQQQMLAIGRALMAKPKLILLDEPSVGLAPLIVEQMFRIIRQINHEGTTILLAEQNANAALKIADKGYVFENGSLVLSGTAEELLVNDEVKKAYIGS